MALDGKKYTLIINENSIPIDTVKVNVGRKKDVKQTGGGQVTFAKYEESSMEFTITQSPITAPRIKYLISLASNDTIIKSVVLYNGNTGEVEVKYRAGELSFEEYPEINAGEGSVGQYSFKLLENNGVML